MKTREVILSLLVGATVAAGCRARRPAPLPAKPAPTTTRAATGETLDDVRTMWTHAWEKKVVGKDYEAYAQKIDQRPRDETFARVVEALYRPIERREITGNQFLNLLGRPDLWFHAADGRVLLVYFYQSAERKMESRVFVNAEGYVEQVSWEPFGGNVYGPEFHRD